MVALVLEEGNTKIGKIIALPMSSLLVSILYIPAGKVQVFPLLKILVLSPVHTLKVITDAFYSNRANKE